jgi:hypothetical protein
MHVPVHNADPIVEQLENQMKSQNSAMQELRQEQATQETKQDENFERLMTAFMGLLPHTKKTKQKCNTRKHQASQDHNSASHNAGIQR